MDSSNAFGRKIIKIGTSVGNAGGKTKSKKKKLSSDLLEQKLKIKRERGFYKDMKKAYPIGELTSPGLRSDARREQHSRKVDIRRAQEAFKAAKKAARKTKKASKK
tara:strand:- start:5295 stop:5612 length:318 start_codon:yes stop_codon:yes gene_type:complete